MNEEAIALARVLRKDRRYAPDAYFFVREALGFAADKLELRNCNCQDSPDPKQKSLGSANCDSDKCDAEAADDANCTANEHHVTGQQLCDGIRQYALAQFGLMSKVVLNSWGIFSTSDFGEIVYNLINVGVLKKSPQDRRSHFDAVYDFDEAFDSAVAVTEAFPSKLASHP
jgi:uncharacterized repeat protein (TIGR04138 family)